MGKAKDGKAAKAPAIEPKAGKELDAAQESAVLGNLSGTVLDGFARLYEIERDIQAARIKHIAPLTEQRKEAWTALRADSSMQREDLSLSFAFYQRVRDLEDFEDQEAAAVIKDNLRRIWQATKMGETLSFLDAVETVQPDNGDAPVSAKREGYRDFGLGMQFDQCPYKDNVNREAWQAGFLSAQQTFKKDGPPKPPAAPADAQTSH